MDIETGIVAETIDVIAKTLGIVDFSPAASRTLAPEVEHRIREIIQEAVKCMRHSKRNCLTVDDVDGALSLRNLDRIFGFTSKDNLRFKKAVGHKDLFNINDKDVELKNVVNAPLTTAPLDISVIVHWLAVEGIQPAVPGNPPVEVLRSCENKRFGFKEDGLPMDIKLPAKHILSMELKLFFDKIKEVAIGKYDHAIFREALVSLSTDPGIQPLVPYFVYFIQDEVARNLSNSSLLFGLMRVVLSILQNPFIHIEPYLHQLIPSVITCLVSKRFVDRFSGNHWALRDIAADILGSICKRFGHVYNGLCARVTRTLLNIFMDPTLTLPQHYGAIQGLAAIGSTVVSALILPNLELYMQFLEPEMVPKKQRSEVKRHEAWRVYGAMLKAIGLCVYGESKGCPSSTSSPPKIAWKNKGKVAATAVLPRSPMKRRRMEGTTIPAGVMQRLPRERRKDCVKNYSLMQSISLECFGDSLLCFTSFSYEKSLFL